MSTILVIDDESVLARNIARFLELRGYDVVTAASLAAAQAKYAEHKPDVALAREGGVIDALTPGGAVVTATTSWGKSAKTDVFDLLAAPGHQR